MKRLTGLPPKGTGIAQWYMTRKAITRSCPECGKEYEDSPYVLEYIAQFDHGGSQKRKHPGWDETGWLVLWEHTHGSIFAVWHAYEVVTAAQVAIWGRELGGWESQ